MHPTLLKLGFLGINWFGKDNVGSDQVVKFLQDHENVLVYENWSQNFFSGLKWAIVKWLYHIDQAIFKLIPKAFDVKALFQDAGITGLKADLVSGGLITALLAISMIWFLIKKQFFPNTAPELKSAITHLIISIVLITSTGTLVNKALDLSEGVFNGAVQTSEGSLPFKLIKDNTLDLFQLAKNGWRTTDIVTATPDGKQKVTKNENALSEKTFDTTDMNFVITPDVIDDIQDSDDLSKNVKKTLKDNLIYRLDHNESNEAVARKIDDGSPLNDVFMPGYARFVAPGYVLIIGLISLGIASFFILYTILDTILQLVIASILANLVYATDLESGQRTKAVVTDLINSAAVIGFTGVEYDFYAIGLTWASKNIDNPILNIMMLIALTMILIMGSNAVLKYFNVDTAIKNNGSGLFKAAVAGNMAAHGAASAANVAKEVGGTALHAAGNTANVARQALSGLRNSIDNHTSGPNMNPDQTSGGLGLGQMIAGRGKEAANNFDNSDFAKRTGLSFDQSDVNSDSQSDSQSNTDSNNQSQANNQSQSNSNADSTSNSDSKNDNQSQSNSTSDSENQNSRQGNIDNQTEADSNLNTNDLEEDGVRGTQGLSTKISDVSDNDTSGSSNATDSGGSNQPDSDGRSVNGLNEQQLAGNTAKVLDSTGSEQVADTDNDPKKDSTNQDANNLPGDGSEPTVNEFNENQNNNPDTSSANSNQGSDLNSESNGIHSSEEDLKANVDEANLPTSDQKISEITDPNAKTDMSQSDNSQKNDFEQPKISDTNLSPDDTSIGSSNPDINSNLGSDSEAAKISQKVNNSAEADTNKINQGFDSIRKRNEDDLKENS